MNLVSLQMAKDHLNVPDDDQDILIDMYCSAASGAVLNYLGGASPWDPVRDAEGVIQLDSNDEIVYDTDTLRHEVQASILFLVGYLFRNRDENPAGAFEHGFLPAPVTALLYPLRDPVVA